MIYALVALALTALSGAVVALLYRSQRDAALASASESRRVAVVLDDARARALEREAAVRREIDAERAAHATDVRELTDQAGRLAGDNARLTRELDDAVRHDPVRAGAVLDAALGERVSPRPAGADTHGGGADAPAVVPPARAAG